MKTARSQPQRKYRRTPVDDPLLAQHWEELFIKYTQIEGLRKCSALETIAKQFSTSRHTVTYWVFPDARVKQKNRMKGKTRHKNTPEYRLRNNTTTYVHRNIEFYIKRVFEKTNYHPLSIDDIRYGIQDILSADNRPKVLIRGSTLIKLISKSENDIRKKIIEKINNYIPLNLK